MNFLIKRIIRNVTIGAPSKCYLLMCDHQIIASIRQHSKFLSPDGILNVDKLKTTFSCDDKESEKIITFLTNMQEKQTDCLKNLEYFHAKGVSTSAILQNLHLLKIAPDTIQLNMNWFEQTEWGQVDDFIPCLSIPPSQLTVLDVDLVKDRLCELSRKFSVEICEVAKFVAKHPKIFRKNSACIYGKFDLMLQFGFHPHEMLRDLTIFTCSEEALQIRLELIKEHNIRKPKPWMLKCEDKRFQNMLTVRAEVNELASEAFDYVAYTLDWHGNTLTSKFHNKKFVNDLDLEAVTKVLDTLLKEYTKTDITKYLNVLKLTPEELNNRLQKYRAIDNTGKCPIAKLALGTTNFDLYIKQIQAHACFSLSQK